MMRFMIILVASSWAFTIAWAGYFGSKEDVTVISLIAVVGLTALLFDLNNKIPED